MSDLYDLADYYASQTTSTGLYQPAKVAPSSDVGHRSKTVELDSDEANNTLSFEDMLMLMVTQLQNQTIDNTADTNDMMNQIIQMTVMQALTEMQTKVEDLTEANIMSYSASLVGQTVTMGIVGKDGTLVGEKVGVITATGTYDGQRVVYMGDERFPISQILAVGTLPEKKDDEGAEGEEASGTDAAESEEKTEALG